MATYAIGDLQGSFGPLERLLDKVGFDSARDRLWFTGDLVNRGSESVECLRFVRGLGDVAVTVLGNHDLHLLVVSEGLAKLRGSDTLHELLDAPDRADLLTWLRSRPMLHREGDFAMVHAGLLPQWPVDKAAALAREVENALQAVNYRDFFAAMYGNEPAEWHDDLQGFDRLRVIVNAMTRMRLCSAEGKMEFKHKGEPVNFPAGFMPWFDVPGRRSADHTLICGHWSALDLKITPNLLSLDTGCVWGRALTAVRLEDRAVFEVSCAELAGKAGWE
jgi:bis(5'-nucleosyl)-tetraphosphatase (symmetrical)